MLPEIGSVIAGKYRLLDSLGEGGMGAVFEAEHVLTHKHAAIKWLHAGHLGHEEVLRRLLHEARASARVRHHNVVDVYDVLTEGRAVALVMELLTGEPLSARIARGDLGIHEFLQLLLPAMRGVAAAHAAGVIHRDVKPDNIFLAREAGHLGPVPKVIDFGISKVTDAGAEGGASRSGLTMGTPRYVSYEQLAGYRDVDGRTDVYAFGVMLYESLTGRAPYDEASTFSQQALLFATSTPLPPSAFRRGIPADLDALVMRAIARDRDSRVPTMDTLIAGLLPFVGARAGELPDLNMTDASVLRASMPAPGQVTTPAFDTPVPVPSAGAPAPSAPVPAPDGKRATPGAWLWMTLLLVLAFAALWASVRPQAAPLPSTRPTATVAPRTPSERPVAPPPRVEVTPHASDTPVETAVPEATSPRVVNSPAARRNRTLSPVTRRPVPADETKVDNEAKKISKPGAGRVSRDEF